MHRPDQYSAIDTRLFAPHPLLADLIHCLVSKILPGGHYMLPANLQPVLLVIVRGSILVHGPYGKMVPAAALSLSGGTSVPQSATSEPGTEILMVTVRAGQLRRLLGLPAGEISEELVPLDALLSRPEAAILAERLAESRSLDERVEAIQHFLLSQRRRHAAAAPDLVIPSDWIDRPVAKLAEQWGIGIRQFERRFAASYGQSLRAYRNQLRCSQLVGSLLGPRPESDWAGIAADAGYFDQAHLSREVRRFTGHTPTELAHAIGSDDPAMWPYRFSGAQIARIFGGRGY